MRRDLAAHEIIREAECATYGAKSPDPVILFDGCSPSIFLASEMGEFFGNGAPGRTRTFDPRLK